MYHIVGLVPLTILNKRGPGQFDSSGDLWTRTHHYDSDTDTSTVSIISLRLTRPQ